MYKRLIILLVIFTLLVGARYLRYETISTEILSTGVAVIKEDRWTDSFWRYFYSYREGKLEKPLNQYDDSVVLKNSIATNLWRVAIIGDLIAIGYYTRKWLK